MNIIIISGKKGTGKDTLASFFIDKGYYSIAFSDAVKVYIVNYVLPMLGVIGVGVKWFYTQSLKETGLNYFYADGVEVTPRNLMQKYGQLMKSCFGNDFWIKKVVDNIKRFQNNYVITDARFVYEIDGIEKEFGKEHIITKIKVYRDTGFSDDDISEIHLDGLEDDYFDAVINNDSSIPNLFKKIESYLVEGIISE